VPVQAVDYAAANDRPARHRQPGYPTPEPDTALRFSHPKAAEIRVNVSASTMVAQPPFLCVPPVRDWAVGGPCAGGSFSAGASCLWSGLN
jgi:hypothetical protein